MRVNRLIILVVVIITIVIMSLIIVPQKQPINTKEEAQFIANEYIDKKFGDEFSNCVIANVDLEDGFWVVEYAELNEETKYLAGGGFPVVVIDKDKGRVVNCLFQK